MVLRHYLNVLVRPKDLSRRAVVVHPLDLFWALVRFALADWGECCSSCWAANDQALRCGGDLQAVYTDRRGVEYYIYSPPERSCTLIFLVDEL